MNDPSTRKQLVVIGAGPGGYPAAFYAADLGMDVTLIDVERNPGGVCLHRGCIPSKALLHVAKLIQEARDAKNWGVEFSQPKIDIKRLNAWKEDVVKKLTSGLSTLSKNRKICYIQGQASFADAHTLNIITPEGKTKNLTFEHAIVATGSRPVNIPGLHIDSPNVLDSTGALELKEIPQRMLIVGGGYIGLEMGSVYAALGTEITVAEMTPSLLPGVDKDLLVHLLKRLKSKIKEIKLNTKVTALKEGKNGLQARFLDAKEQVSQGIYDKVLISIGRKPNTEDLGLENTGIQLDDNGFILIDQQRRTKEPNIFAIGDIAGEPMLAHKATYEGKVAVQAASGKRAIYDPVAIPAVVFTDPEIAWTGLSETEAKQNGIKIVTAKFPWAASGRATTLDRSDGLTKLILDPSSEQILGVGLCGPGAGELIAEATLAIEMGANVADISLTIHPHPTLSETIMEAAEVYFGHSPHFYQPKK